jgi:DNA-binding transcriptional MerR regulator
MMTIGRFAQLSGLTVKALRYYDETGLLPPAHVDPDTGYRWYRPGQARRAATISALRSAGLPLEDVRRAVDDPDRLQDELERWRTGLTQERARQDEAIAAAVATLADYDRTVPVVRRQAPEQHYVGVELDADVLEADPDDGAAAMEAAWQRLGAAVAARGTEPTGAWTTIRPEEPGSPAQAVLCLGVPERWSDASGAVSEHGTLPARTELAVVLEPGPGTDAPGADGAPPSALLALLEHLERSGADAGTIRQTPLVDEHGGFRGLEVSVTLEQPAA